MVQGNLAGRFRSGHLLSLEIGGCLSWHGLFLGVGYQLAAEWDLEGRSVQVRTVPLTAGWRPGLWRRRSWEVRAELALLVEYLMLRRLDLPQAGTHSHWDAGLGVGLILAYRFASGLGVGIGATGIWFPAAQTIEIENGPSAKLNDLGARLAMFLEWRGTR